MEEKLYHVVRQEVVDWMTSDEAAHAALKWATDRPGVKFVVLRAAHAVKVETTTTVKRTDYPLEAAATATPDDDVWITWNGGECPVGVDVLVDAKSADGTAYKNLRAWQFDWVKRGSLGLVAYRIAK
jgi:hypothetical protein